MNKIFIAVSLFFASGFIYAQKHTVSAKETAYSIARQYHITLKQLYELNPGLENRTLQIGQEILVGKSNVKTPVQSNVSDKNTLAKIVIQPKQTIYRIIHQYHISESELRKLNPDLENHMKIGDEIVLPENLINKYADSSVKKLPINSETPVSTKVVEQKEEAEKEVHYVTYKVQEGDEVFSILNKFDIDMNQLLELNPSISNGLKTGMMLNIKKQNESYIKKNKEALGVVVMLPFGFNEGDLKYRKISTEFLSGAKLAMEMSAKKGQKLDVKIIDAGNEKTFKSNLTQINKSNTDLIVGPFFKSNVLEVLDYVKDYKIPVVAPLANDDEMKNYSNLVIIETDKNIYADRIASEVKNIYHGQKIYIVSGGNQENADYLKKGLEKLIKKSEIKLVKSSSEMKPFADESVITILASDDSSEGNRYVNKIISLKDKVKEMKSFSQFYHPVFDKKVDELSQFQFVYIMDRKINPDGDFEKDVLKNYQASYSRLPSKYAVIGFDVMSDILSRENKNGEIFKQMDKIQTQLATKFEFVREKSNGAFVNVGYRVVRLVQ